MTLDHIFFLGWSQIVSREEHYGKYLDPQGAENKFATGFFLTIIREILSRQHSQWQIQLSVLPQDYPSLKILRTGRGHQNWYEQTVKLNRHDYKKSPEMHQSAHFKLNTTLSHQNHHVNNGVDICNNYRNTGVNWIRLYCSMKIQLSQTFLMQMCDLQKIV